MTTGYLAFGGMLTPLCFGDLDMYWRAFQPEWASIVNNPGHGGEAAAGPSRPTAPAGLPEPMVSYIVFQVAIAALKMLSAGVVHT